MNCPNCSYRLKIWDIKAECPKCGINIPNHNWEENLEKDSLRSDAAFRKLKMTLANLRASLIGDKLQIIRLIFTFVPLVALVLPLVKICVNLPYVTDAPVNISVLSIVLHVINTSGIDGVLSLIKGELSADLFLTALLAIFCIALGVLLAVLSFFILIIRSFRLGWRGCFTCNVFCALLWAAAGVLFKLFADGIYASTVDFLSSWSIGFGLFVGIALFVFNATINFIDGRRILDKKKKAFDLEMASFSEQYKDIL